MRRSGAGGRAVADAIVAAIRRENAGVEVTDRGSYLRVLVPARCAVSRAAIEAALEPSVPAAGRSRAGDAVVSRALSRLGGQACWSLGAPERATGMNAAAQDLFAPRGDAPHADRLRDRDVAAAVLLRSRRLRGRAADVGLVPRATRSARRWSPRAPARRRLGGVRGSARHDVRQLRRAAARSRGVRRARARAASSRAAGRDAAARRGWRRWSARCRRCASSITACRWRRRTSRRWRRAAASPSPPLFQTGDELRRIHGIAFRMAQLRAIAGPTLRRERPRALAERSAWQPLRRTIEKLLVTYDWGEALVALNVCVRPLVDELFLVGLADAGRARTATTPTRRCCARSPTTAAGSASGPSALLRVARPTRRRRRDERARAAIAGWIDDWRPRVGGGRPRAAAPTSAPMAPAIAARAYQSAGAVRSTVHAGGARCRVKTLAGATRRRRWRCSTQLADSAGDGCWRFDRDLRCIYCQPGGAPAGRLRRRCRRRHADGAWSGARRATRRSRSSRARRCARRSTASADLARRRAVPGADGAESRFFDGAVLRRCAAGGRGGRRRRR